MKIRFSGESSRILRDTGYDGWLSIEPHIKAAIHAGQDVDDSGEGRAVWVEFCQAPGNVGLAILSTNPKVKPTGLPCFVQMKLETKYCGLTDVGQKAPKKTRITSSLIQVWACMWSATAWGGHAAGHIASKIAVQIFHNEVFQAQDIIQNYLNGGGNTSKMDIVSLLAFCRQPSLQ
jgi:hypothetical protein